MSQVTYKPEYLLASLAAAKIIAPSANRWGPSTESERAADRDAARTFDAAGCDMPEGGLTAAQEWALEFSGWLDGDAT